MVLMSLVTTESQNVSQLYNASYQDLTAVPLDIIPEDVQDLRLDHNLLTELPPDAFRSLIRLNNLSLSYNNLHTEGIDRHCLAGTVVAHLYLDHNYLSDVPYLNHSHVVQLSMRHNSILRVEDGAFQGMPLLTSVHFRRNQIHYINPSAFCGTRLRTIELSYNTLSVLPEFLCLNNTLKYLSLNANNIRSIQSTDFHGLKILQKLLLNRNRLHAISDFDVKLGPSLVVLALQRNGLETLDVQWSHFRSLKILTLAQNNLECFEMVGDI